MEYKFTSGTDEINDWDKGIHGKFDSKVVVEVDNGVFGDILNFAVRCAMGGTSDRIIADIAYIKCLLPHLNNEVLYEFKKDYEYYKKIMNEITELGFNNSSIPISWVDFYKDVCEELNKRENKPHWIMSTYPKATPIGDCEWTDYVCSECEHIQDYPTEYCEECGAKLISDKEENKYGTD